MPASDGPTITCGLALALGLATVQSALNDIESRWITRIAELMEAIADRASSQPH